MELVVSSVSIEPVSEVLSSNVRPQNIYLEEDFSRISSVDIHLYHLSTCHSKATSLNILYIKLEGIIWCPAFQT